MRADPSVDLLANLKAALSAVQTVWWRVEHSAACWVERSAAYWAQHWAEYSVVMTVFHRAVTKDVQLAAHLAGLWVVCWAGPRVAMTAELMAEHLAAC